MKFEYIKVDNLEKIGNYEYIDLYANSMPSLSKRWFKGESSQIVKTKLYRKNGHKKSVRNNRWCYISNGAPLALSSYHTVYEMIDAYKAQLNLEENK